MVFTVSGYNRANLLSYLGRVTDMFYYGRTVIFDHGHNLTSSFLHLSKALVKKGQMVRKGDLIAEVGTTGISTGPHLDWCMDIQNSHVDPQFVGAADVEKTAGKFG